MELRDAQAGRSIIYTPHKGCPADQRERGIITSANHKYVFVRYGNDLHSKATNPADIEYEGSGDPHAPADG